MMKKLLLLTGWLTCVAIQAMAQADTAAAWEETTAVYDETAAVQSLSVNGNLLTDDRLRSYDAALHRQEYRLTLKGEYKVSDRARFYAETWLRTYRFPTPANLEELSDKDNVFRTGLELREAYVDLYGFLTPNLDVRIGRQRIAWGTADKMNPTDLLNPYDMEDVWDFGRHLGSNGIKLTYYAHRFTFTAVGIPFFTPSVLPGSDWTPAFMPSYSMPDLVYDSSTMPGFVVPIHITQGSITDKIILPAAKLRHSPVFGLKVKHSIGNFDLSLSYIYGRDPLPAVNKMHTSLRIDSLLFFPSPEAFAVTDISAELIYPHFKMLGFDFQGSLLGAGIRGEAGLYLPDEVLMKRTLTYSVPSLGITADSVLSDSVSVSGKAYIKWVLGADYTFRNGMYINVQYLKGFLHERGQDALKDYLMLAFDMKFFREKLILSPVNAALQINDFKDITKNYALLWMPELRYKPIDNTEIKVGYRMIEGKGDSGFSKVHLNDELFVGCSFSF